MEEKIAKVYRILKWVFLGIFSICMLILFLPKEIFPFDISTFRSYASLWLILIILVSFSCFIYFLIYPALEKFKENLRKSFLEETNDKFEEVNKQIKELEQKVDKLENNK